MALSENRISQRSVQVIKNIQDCRYNYSKLKTAKDDLKQNTTYTAHKDDTKRDREDTDNTNTIDEIAELFQQLDNVGVRQVHPAKRRLSIIANRHKIAEQNISNCTEQFPDIMDIQENIIVSTNITENLNNTQDLTKGNSNQNNNDNNTITSDMIIDILNNVVLANLPY